MNYLSDPYHISFIHSELLTIILVFPSQTQLDANSALLLLQFSHHDSSGPVSPSKTYS